jgi:farnesyl diphosphate synthase
VDLKVADFATQLSDAAKTVDQVMLGLFGDKVLPGEILRPARVTESMTYAALAGGKRLRPFLVIETAKLFGKEGEGVLRAAAAIECVHCYSLVHDDLPAMDNDDLRRGKPTTHKKYDEATAILAGDALLTYAFDILADEPTSADPLVRVALVKTLARASGLGGMVGGQLLDLEAEGRFHPDGKPLQLDDKQILRLQAMKTGALLMAGVDMGAILGGASKAEREALGRYGRALGQAFQIADDLLDEEADAATVGKATGKDAAMGKGTLVRLWGKNAARKRLGDLVHEAEGALSGFGEKAATLREAARFVANRDR